MRYLLSCFVLLVTACGSIGGPSLDELNATTAFPDPSVDTTIPPDAPFVPGQRRDAGDTEATYVRPTWNGYIEGVAMPGDLDGDGHDDLIFFGTEHDEPDIVPCDDGCPGFSRFVIDVVYGGAHVRGADALEPAARIESPHVNGLRASVAAGGDVDGDGDADLIVSVGTSGCEQGSVYVVSGGARLSGTNDVRDLGALLREEGTCTGYGAGAGVGDVDDDGLADFVITAPEDGRGYLYYGAAGEAPARRAEADADASFTGAPIRRALSAGDVNGDGVGDLLLRAADTDAGASTYFLVLGGERRAGEVALDEGATRIEGVEVSPIGDVDGDGLDDLGVTGRVATNDGWGQLIAGRESWPAELDLDEAGAWVERGDVIQTLGDTRFVAAGDLNADGHADLLYVDSAFGSDAPGESPDDPAPRGAVLLFAGPIDLAGGALHPDDATIFVGRRYEDANQAGRQRGFDQLGDGIATGGDLDGDGIDDLVLAATSAPDGGRVYLWRGRE